MQSIQRAIRITASLSVIAALSFSTSAVAQDQPEESSAQLEDIVVTAQRRSENLQNVPIAVTALSAERLTGAGIQSAQDLSLVTPAMTAPDTIGVFQPRIRAVGSGSIAPGNEMPIATYVDGVYLANAPSSLLTLNGVERIEVLKGPQGTLFGRNSTGGLINVITRDPQETMSANVSFGFANYGDVTGDAYVTGGLTPNILADVALHYEYQDKPYGINLGTGNETGRLKKDFVGRSKLLLKLSDRTEIRLIGDYSERDTTRNVTIPYPGYPQNTNSSRFGGPFPQGRTRDINSNFDPYIRIKGWGVSGNLTHEFDAVTVQSITAFRNTKYSVGLDADFIPVDLLTVTEDVDTDQFTQELKITSNGGGRFKWTAGAFYFYAKDRLEPEHIHLNGVRSPIPNVPFDIYIDDYQTGRSIAGYAQGSYEIFPDTNLTLGGRYTYEKKRMGGTQTVFVGGTQVSATPLPPAPIPSSVSFERFNYRIAIDHRFSPTILGYISYNTGFKSGGFNILQAANPPFAPETNRAFEVGLKSELFDRRLRANISAFRYDYSNIQFDRRVGGSSVTYNAAKARIYGVDIDVEAVLVDGLTISGGASYIHDRFLSFPNADYFPGVDGCAAPLGTFCSQSAKGNKLPFAPTFSFNAGVDYDLETSVGKFEFNANVAYYSTQYGTPDNFVKQNPYALVNGSITWNHPGENFYIRLWGRNLTDKVYATVMSEAESGINRQIGQPRTYGVTAGFKF
jgi:iron complex outermembrane receptor protein